MIFSWVVWSLMFGIAPDQSRFHGVMDNPKDDQR